MASSQIKYIEACKHIVCDDLRQLVKNRLPSFYHLWEKLPKDHRLYDEEYSHSRIREEALENKLSAAYWQLHAESTFLSCSFAFDQLLVEHNEKFFFLTPQNLHIKNSVWSSCIMFRLGQHDNFTYLGMPVVICDAAGKLRMSPSANFGSQSSELREGVPYNIKIPSAGLDTIRLVLDFMRQSYEDYIKGHEKAEDAQKFVQLKRTTEAGLQVGYIMFINNKAERMPESELAADCVMPEVILFLHFCSCLERL